MQLFRAIFGGGGGSKPAAAPAPAASAKSTITGANVAPGMDPNKYKTDELAYYQQFLQGTGQGPEALAGIQANIDKQASLL